MGEKIRLSGWLALCISLVGSGGASAQEVMLRAVGAFNKDASVSAPFEEFINWVNENGKDLVQIRHVGGPEAIPPFELANAVSTGVVDIGFVPHAYYTGLVPGSAMLKLATNTIQDQRKNGCYEKLDMLHQEQMNAKYLGRTGDHIQYHLYLNEKLETADLSGLTIRVTPIYQAMFGALNANMVNTPPGDVYTALERGAVQGYGWPSVGIFDLGWQEHTKYRVEPGFYQQDVNILVNYDKWQSLTERQRAFLEEAMEVAEARNADNVALVKAEKQRHAEVGIETMELTGAERDKWLATAAEIGKAEIAKTDPEAVELLSDCLTGAE